MHPQSRRAGTSRWPALANLSWLSQHHTYDSKNIGPITIENDQAKKHHKAKANPARSPVNGARGKNTTVLPVLKDGPKPLRGKLRKRGCRQRSPCEIYTRSEAELGNAVRAKFTLIPKPCLEIPERREFRRSASFFVTGVKPNEAVLERGKNKDVRNVKNRRRLLTRS